MGKFKVYWIDWPIDGIGFFDSGFRLNGGGFMHGASPYRYWRIWRLMIKRYL